MNKSFFALFSVFTLMITGISAYADYDAALEAREEAKRQAAHAAAAQQQAKMNAMKHESEVKMYKEMLGSEADGKSDAELEKLYQAKIKKMQSDSIKASQDNQVMVKQLMKQEADTRSERDAAMKSMTGKSATELYSMSDAELEAFANEMEKKYGGK